MEGRQQGKRFRLPVCCSKGHITAEQLSPVDAKREQDTGLAAFLMANATGWQPYAAASVMPNASATTASSAVVCCRCVLSYVAAPCSAVAWCLAQDATFRVPSLGQIGFPHSSSRLLGFSRLRCDCHAVPCPAASFSHQQVATWSPTV